MTCFKFDIGEHVIISDKGDIYTTYTTMAKKMELQSFQQGWNKDFGLNGSVGVILKSFKETDGGLVNAIYGVYLPLEKKDVIIGERGLTSINYNFDEDLFSL